MSAGAAIAQAAYGVAQRAAAQFLSEGRYEAMYETAADYARTNALLSRRCAE